MRCRIFYYLFLILILNVNAQKINIRGKVTNQSNKPIAKAVVALVNQNLADTTDSEGNYTITADNLSVLQQSVLTQENIAINNSGVITFSLSKNSKIKIEVYDIKGKNIKTIHLPNISAGTYNLNIEEYFSTSKLVLIRARINDNIEFLKYIPLHKGINIINYSGKNFSKSTPKFSRIASVVDSLSVTANNYKTKKLPISSYDTTVNVSLDTLTSSNECEGCGNTNYPKSGQYTMNVDGTTREYILKLPNNYEPNKPYKLIFCFHPWGGDMNQIAQQGYYGLERLSNGTAIFVSPNGLEDNNQPRGWANPGGRDIKFVKEMLKYFNSNFCINQKQIFSVGFSYGGMMSFAIGCALNNTFRAIAPMSGAFYSGCDSTSKGPIAVWMAHGKSDNVVPLDHGKQALRYFLARNGCSNETTPVQPSPCVEYKGCKEGYPVIYCEFDGSHGVQNWSAAAVWEFFNQF